MSNHWIVERDLITDGDTPKGTNTNAVGVRSRGYDQWRSGDVSEVNDEALPYEWRAYDDDGELYYTGRAQEEDFHPLDNFAGPNAGATELRFRRNTGGRLSGWTQL